MTPSRRSLVVGIVNNMPEAAFQATADQFDSLLTEAAPHAIDLQLRFYRPPHRDDDDPAANPASGRHEPAEALWMTPLDGLIVTGAEPQAKHIADEPSLPFLSRIAGWAEAGALPVVWSCLAAHAAVYLLDGIQRLQRDAKLFGVFECDKLQDHPLLDGSPARWTIPHSRFNELPEAALTASGYQILTRSADVGVDTFVKQGRAPHVFLSGHPEYGRATLRSEYRRDIRRFLLGERALYPAMPTGYFPEDASLEMAAFRAAASQRRALEWMAHFPAAAATAMPWRKTATGLFQNWLLDLARLKAERSPGISLVSGPAARLSPLSAAGRTQHGHLA